MNNLTKYKTYQENLKNFKNMTEKLLDCTQLFININKTS